jgi:hypothetical protein
MSHHNGGSPYGATHPFFGRKVAGLAVGAIIGIVIAVVFVLAIIGWVVSSPVLLLLP